MGEIETESRRALRELIALLGEIDRRWASDEWNLLGPDDVVGAHRTLMHMLEGGLVTFFESDPSRPRFQRIVTPTRKFTGDNADAIYHDAPVDPRWQYVVRGRMDGAVYVSFTVECDTADGSMASRTGGVINDTQFDVDADGRFEIRLGGAPAERNWLPLESGATRITTRHYYENPTPASADPTRHAALEIERLDGGPPPPPPDDASVAAGIRRVARFLESRTLLQPPMAKAASQPPFVSLVPNQFPKPVPPGNFGLAAFDATYSMAPYFLGPDEALIISGRWPKCRMANVSLWNRFMQTLDYANRTVSRNRAQTTLEPDGSFRIVLAHRDPGHPNWIDTEGKPFGLVFWRFFLVEGEVETPVAEVVPFGEVAARAGRG
jgi:hemin uptake protein HemP